LDVRGVPVWENGEIRKWVGFCRDVTDKINYMQLLTRERDFSDAVIESLPGVFYMTDEADTIVRVNRYAEIVCGYSVDEICGQQGARFVPPEQSEAVRAARQKLIEHGDYLQMELEIVTKAGKRIPLFVNGARFFIDGKPYVIGVGLDISRLKMAEQALRELNVALEERVKERTRQLQESNKQLEGSNKELEAFSYTVSHDLRAPLHAIGGFAEILAEDYGPQLEGEGTELLQRIVEAGERMRRLIDDVLHYSRTGRAALKFVIVPVASVIKYVKKDFDLQLEQIGGELEFAPDLPNVKGDPTLLAQVFSNLFQNAINYRRKEVPVRINVNAQREHDGVVFSVTDNGVGIAPDYRERVFEAFQRLHSEKECPGSGLGLATVKKAVETMGGKVWLESQVGRGTRFFIRLKAAE
ncbi:MAG: PAS domain-containing sensor histidine kinase, partial [Limisphaerales bacterium]